MLEGIYQRTKKIIAMASPLKSLGESSGEERFQRWKKLSQDQSQNETWLITYNDRSFVLKEEGGGYDCVSTDQNSGQVIRVGLRNEGHVMTDLLESRKEHPNILYPVQIGKGKGNSGLPIKDNDIAYPYIESGDLFEFINPIHGQLKNLGALDFCVLKWATQISSALSFVHRNGYYHGDVKPENVLVSDVVVTSKGLDLGAEQLKLADFSFAQKCPEGEVLVRVGTTGKLITAGSGMFIAPETVDRGEHSQQIDSFALGVMLCEMYVGSNIFKECKNSYDVINMIEAIGPKLLEKDRKECDRGYISKERLSVRREFYHIIKCLTLEDPVNRLTIHDANKRLKIIFKNCLQIEESMCRRRNILEYKERLNEQEDATGEVWTVKMSTGEIAVLKQAQVPDKTYRVVNSTKRVSMGIQNEQKVMKALLESETRSPYILLPDYGSHSENVVEEAIGKPCILYPYMPKGDLYNYLENNRQALKDNERDSIFMIRSGFQMASALEFLHQRGMYHGDIKPDNFLVVEEEGETILKLTDFELAQVCPEGEVLTLSCLRGSKDYLPPELMTKGHYSQKMDMFGLGMSLLEMVCGVTVDRAIHMPAEDVVRNYLKRQKSANKMFVEAGTISQEHADILSEFYDLILDLVRTDPEKRTSAREATQKLKELYERIDAEMKKKESRAEKSQDSAENPQELNRFGDKMESKGMPEKKVKKRRGEKCVIQ